MRISSAFPAGVTALLFDEVDRRRRFEDRSVKLLEEKGFSEIVLPILDYFEPYQELLSSELRDELYRFVDRDGELLALRGDFTPMVARVLAPRLESLTLPLRLFYRGDLVRYQEERVGRLREYYELGAELFGVSGPEADEEILSLFLSLVARQGPRVRLVLGFAGALDGLLLERGIENAAELARAISRRERSALGRPEGPLREVLEDGVPGDLNSLGSDRAQSLESVIELGQRLSREFADSALDITVDLAEFAEDFVCSELSEASSRRPYYDGLVFRAYRDGTAPSIGRGGRYDRLFRRLNCELPAVGFSVSVDPLLKGGR